MEKGELLRSSWRKIWAIEPALRRAPRVINRNSERSTAFDGRSACEMLMAVEVTQQTSEITSSGVVVNIHLGPSRDLIQEAAIAAYLPGLFKIEAVGLGVLGYGMIGCRLFLYACHSS